MKILVGHNFYQQPGGEDHVFRTQTQLLKAHGHNVHLYERRNAELKKSDALSLRFSKRSYQDVHALGLGFKPDIAHFHNTFFMMTPSVFYACKNLDIPVVLSAHNYRLMCINGLFFRDNRPCEDCTKQTRLSGIVNRCYRSSFAASTVLTDMVSHHWRRGTWTKMIDRLTVATEFSRRKHIQAGIPEDKITVLPHFVDDPGPVNEAPRQGYALYAGRLSPEKGLNVLLDAWKSIKDIELYIVGSGPMKASLEKRVLDEGLTNVKIFGFIEKVEYIKIMKEAMFLVAPCLSYDNFPMVIVESYSYGVPVLASRLGSLEEAVEDGVTGRLFKPNDAKDLAEKVNDVLQNLSAHQTMCINARKTYELKHSPLKHYEALLKIYHEVSHA